MWRAVKRYFENVRRLEVHIFAAYAAYFLLLSIFPAMMLLVSVLQLTPVSPDGLKELLQGLVPDSLQSLTDYMIDELFGVDAPTILSLSAAAALWMTSKGVLSLQRGLNRIYVARETRNGLWLRVRALIFSLAGILATVLLLFLQLLSREMIGILLAEGNALGDLLLGISRAKHLLSILVLTLIFAVMYTVFPNRPIRLEDSLPGALATAVLWTLFSRLFSLYVDRFTNYSLYYGSLSVIAVTMLWLYACIFLFYCGGLFNRELERHKETQIEKGNTKHP